MTTFAAPVAGAVGGALVESADRLASTALALARRFAAGATLWCLAPGADHCANHLAVEFVHPVIVGKRSLPAAALDATDPIGSARLLVRAGDVVVLMGSADDPTIAALLRRGEAWGVETVLLAVGPEPDGAGRADHVVWTGPLDDGGLLLSFHLLWELTHVVFEHPGLLVDDTVPVCRDDICITCSDEGRIVEVVSLIDERTAVVLAAGQRECADLTVVDAVVPGDLLLVHAGLALTIVEGGGAR